MQNSYERIQTHDAELFAISTDNLQRTRLTVQRENLDFPVLSDEDLDAVIPYNIEDQENRGNARPSTFLLEADGTIVWKSLDTIDNRVPTNRIMNELSKLW